MPHTRSVIRLDAGSVRALAHPLRVRIVGDLRIHGPATATILAQRLAESSGATSYHVRVLAENGFVEEDPARGTGRERWWRATHEMTSWRSEEFLGDPDARAAEEWLIGFHARRAMEAIDEWLARRPSADPALVAVADQGDYWFRMTPAQVKAMLDEVHEVIGRHRDGAHGADTASPSHLPAGAEAAAGLVRLFLFAVPGVDPDEDPGEDAG